MTKTPFFSLGGTWRPASADWPASYAVLTTEAYPDIAPFCDEAVRRCTIECA